MITKEQLKELGFTTRYSKNALKKRVKREYIARRHSILKLDNDMALLIRGHRIFYVKEYMSLLDLWNNGYHDMFLSRLWKFGNLDIGKVKRQDIAKIVEGAKMPKTIDNKGVEGNDQDHEENGQTKVVRSGEEKGREK